MPQATTESFVGVAVDGAGKAIRNLQLTVSEPDGTLKTVQMQVIEIADPFTGKILDLNIKPLLEELLEQSGRYTSAIEILAGVGRADELVAGYQVRQNMGVPAAPGQPVTGVADPFGRQITVPWGARDLFIPGVAPTLTDTSAQTLKSAEPGIYLDMVGLCITNTSVGTSSRVDISDGTKTYSWQSIGGAPTVGFWGGGLILPASSAGVPWTIQAAVAVTDIRAFAMFVRNK